MEAVFSSMNNFIRTNKSCSTMTKLRRNHNQLILLSQQNFVTKFSQMIANTLRIRLITKELWKTSQQENAQELPSTIFSGQLLRLLNVKQLDFCNRYELKINYQACMMFQNIFYIRVRYQYGWLRSGKLQKCRHTGSYKPNMICRHHSESDEQIPKAFPE